MPGHTPIDHSLAAVSVFADARPDGLETSWCRGGGCSLNLPKSVTHFARAAGLRGETSRKKST